MSKNRSDHHPSRQMTNSTANRSSLSPSSRVQQRPVSSHRSSTRSMTSSNTSHSRVPRSIQIEPGLQALLTAEGQAAELVANARVKRRELLRRAQHESQAELEAFRQERAFQYTVKLHEATQLEQFQSKLDADRQILLAQMKETMRKERKSLIHYIVHRVVNDIPIQLHPNAKRVTLNSEK